MLNNTTTTCTEYKYSYIPTVIQAPSDIALACLGVFSAVQSVGYNLEGIPVVHVQVVGCFAFSVH
jgi:hypothetical protein